MDKDHINKNRLREISATFLGHTVSRFIDEDEQRFTYDRGLLDELNRSIEGHLSADLVMPTLKYLINHKLAVATDISGLRDRSLLDALYKKRMDLDRLLIQEHDRADAYLFLYTGENAYRSILESEHLYARAAADPGGRKIFGICYEYCGKLEKDQIFFGALPKELIEKETFIPQFVQLVIDNQ